MSPRLHRFTLAWWLLWAAPPLVAPPAGAAAAEDEPWSLCAPMPGATREDYAEVEPDTPIELSARRAHIERMGLSMLRGDVDVRRGGQHLSAEEVDYRRATQHAQARRDVTFADQGLTVTGPQAEVWLDTGEAIVSRARYTYAPSHARGTAERLHRRRPGLTTLNDATYTTCDAGATDWLLSAERVKLDRDSGDATGRNVVLRFKRLPIFYTPWIRFPIDDRRKSGFLFPSAGVSGNSGFELALPFYWNIAANYDATLTPRILAERGLQLGSEFRYLNRRGRGQLDLQFLDDNKTDDQRFLAAIDHESTLTPRLRADIDAIHVSDEDYFDDFGNDLASTSLTHLERRADLRYFGGFWDAVTRVQDFQTIDGTLPPNSQPYARLPQLLLTGGLPDQALGLGYDARGEWVNFVQNDRIQGNRTDLEAAVERPWIGPGYFLTPALKLRYTRYRLDDAFQGGDEDPVRTVPLASLDGGLVFERAIGDGALTQTLEPRLYYLYVPFREQDDIPDFDSTRLDFSFAQLFRDNRFSGRDRVGDANQLTLALTSRVLDNSDGAERLAASVGNIVYFRDRRVTLPGEPPERTGNSDVAAELRARLGERWSASTAGLWDPQDGNLRRATARLSYRAPDNRIVNLAYRLRRDPLDRPDLEINQTDLAFAWPLTPRWRILGRWNHDLALNRELEVLGGFEYESCCWKLRLAGRRYIDEGDVGSEANYNNSIEFQLVLKGLAGFGSGLGQLLEQGILGYEGDADTAF